MSAFTANTTPNPATKIQGIQLPGFACRWRALDGARELRRIFERIDFGSAEYETRAFTRLKQLRYLQRTGQIDQDLFWSALEPAAAAATNNAHRLPEIANESRWCFSAEDWAPGCARIRRGLQSRW
jgi:hypothetical protein